MIKATRLTLPKKIEKIRKKTEKFVWNKNYTKTYFVLLNFIKIYCILIVIGNDESRCVRGTTYIYSFTVRTEVVSMVESALITIIYLLFYGLIGVTIINIALIITLVIIMSI